MEDMIAGSAAPLTKVLEMVDRSEAYIGIFAWRYGYIPDREINTLQNKILIDLNFYNKQDYSM